MFTPVDERRANQGVWDEWEYLDSVMEKAARAPAKVKYTIPQPAEIAGRPRVEALKEALRDTDLPCQVSPGYSTSPLGGRREKKSGLRK